MFLTEQTVGQLLLLVCSLLLHPSPSAWVVPVVALAALVLAVLATVIVLAIVVLLLSVVWLRSSVVAVAVVLVPLPFWVLV